MVMFFFVLSGVVLTRALVASGFPLTAIGFARYAAQRVIRLCVPALAATLLSIALYHLTFRGPQAWPSEWLRLDWSEAQSAGMLARHSLLFGRDNEFGFDPSLWSLEHELRLSVLLPLLAAIPVLRLPVGWVMLAALGLLVPASLVVLLHLPFYQMELGPTLVATALVSAYFAGAFAIGAAYAFADVGTRVVATPARKTAAAAVILILSCTTYDPAAVVTSLLILWLAQQPSTFRNLLRRMPLRVAGRYSFSLYLIHLPVLFAATQTFGLGWRGIGAYVLLTGAGTAILFHAAEQPAHRLAKMVARLGHPVVSRPVSPLFGAHVDS